MRIQASLLSLVLASSLLAQAPEPAETVFDAALDQVREELNFMALSQLGEGKFPANAIAVDERTIGGAPQGFGEFTSAFFGSVIADELLDSYGAHGPAVRRITRATADGFAVLPLDEFSSGPHSYDWHRLSAKHSGVRYVVRLSWPAIDKLGTCAVVRYEIIGAKGRDRAVFLKFEKQSDGTWKAGIGQVGNIWN